MVVPAAVVRRVSIDDITHHFRLQITDLTSELDLAHQICTIGIETIYGSHSAQSMGGNAQVLHDPAGHNAQRGSWINLNAAHFR